MPAIIVSELAIAPVKGLRLAPADELELRPSGAVGDRTFVVVDEADHALLLTGAQDAAEGKHARQRTNNPQ